MSKTTKLQLPIIALKHPSGCQLSSIGYTSDWFIGGSSFRLAERFAKAAHKKLLQRGRYFSLLPFIPKQTPIISQLQISLPASQERFDPFPCEISFPLIKWQGEDGSVIAMLPSLGVGYHHNNDDDFQEQLQNIAQLTLKRDKRLHDTRQLIATHWYENAEICYESASVEIYTPNELEAFQFDQKEPLLPRTASRMNRSTSAFFNLEDKLTLLCESLQSDYRQSVLLVGPSGCGKTALVQAYEQKVGRQWDKKPWVTSAARLLQVLTEDGSWQYGLGLWVKELQERGDVVYLGNLAEWFEVGQYAGNAISIGEALKDTLSRNTILAIAEVTQEQLDIIELRYPGYRELFTIIEFTDDTQLAQQTALQAIQSLANQHKKMIEDSALITLQKLQQRYMPYSGYPGKTIRFFESLILQSQDPAINLQQTLDAFCEDTGMPLFLVDAETPLDSTVLEGQLMSGVIGQDAAVTELVEAVLTTKAGMAKLGRPIMSLLFVGPTGVGKTQLAKTLANTVFGDGKRMLRFDMSEYSDPYTVSRLTSTSESSLVSQIRQQPFSVVLFDEIEKAAHHFFDLLLQVLGEGRLTDDQGNIANFCSTIIIMTSNLGAQDYMQPGIGFANSRNHNRNHSRNHSSDQMSDHFEAAVTQHFRPELFNRIDRVVPFGPLSENHQAKIIEKEVNNLLKSPGIAHRKVSITIDDSVWQWLQTLNIDFRYGARAIQRQLQKYLMSPLAKALCLEPVETPMTLALSSSDNQLIIEKTIHNESQKSLGAFSQFTDKVSTLRRQIRYLNDSSTWIHLLSRIDQLEHKKTRKKQNFWANPEYVQALSHLDELKQRYTKQQQDIVRFESLCLSQYQEQTVDILWQDYHHQLARYQQYFIQLLKDTEAYIHPNNNHVVLGCYGVGSLLKELKAFYEGIAEHFQWRCTVYNIYYVKQAKTIDELTEALKPDRKEIEINSQEEDVSYWRSARKLSHNFLVKTGYLYTIEGPCAAHYLANESGLVESINGKQKNTAFIALSKGDIKDHSIPDGIERKEFYKSRKKQRVIEDRLYTDERFHKEQSLPLKQHSVEMETLVTTTLLKKFTTKNNKEG